MTVADIFAVGTSIKAPDGTVYTLKELTLYQQGEFQRWLEQRAHDAVERSDATDDAKDRRHAIIDRDAGLGRYEYDGPFGVEAMCTPAGLTKLVEIACRDQGMTAAKAGEVMRHSFREVAATFIRKAVEDPKVAAAALAALGLPPDWLPSTPSGPSSPSSSTPPSTAPSPNSADSPTDSSCSSTTSSAAKAG